MQKTYYLLLVTVLSLSLIGCDFVKKDRHNIVVLIDYSASSRSDILNRHINTVTNDIFLNMSQYDCLTVMPIDEGSKKEPVKMIYEDFIEKKFILQSDGFAHAQDSVRKRITEYVKENTPKIAQVLVEQKQIRRSYTRFTDIFGALQQLPNVIEIDKKTFWENTVDFVMGKQSYNSENVVVLLSDMIQDSEEYNFNSGKSVTANRTEKILENLSKLDKIPNLRRCKIFVIGSTGKNSTQIDNIKYFWEKYFKKTRAELNSYGFNVEDKLRKHLKGLN